MTTVIPMPGLRFATERIGTMADVISPPYDKISFEERRELSLRSEFNVVRIILPPPSEIDTDVMTQSMDTETSDWYQQSAERLQAWQQSGIMQPDPSQVYVYKQTFQYKETPYTRCGIFGALRLEDQSGPHAHEFTFEGPKADRLRLLQATKTNTSPIFLLSDGEQSDWDEIIHADHRPLLHFTDRENQTHELFSIPAEESAKACAYIQQRTLVIADGHHRYETAVNYRHYMKEKTGFDPATQAWGYVFALIVPISSPGLLVLPTHRVLKNLPDRWADSIKACAGSCCTVTPIEELTGAKVREILDMPGNENNLVVCTKDEGFMIAIPDANSIDALESISPKTRELNVSLLHHFLFPHCMHLSKEHLQNHTRYIRAEEEAIKMVRGGAYDAAFLCKGIPVETVFDISLAGVRMPQKSTDFFPKIPTGLIMRSAEGPV
jgi:uncharacterized protein (DUF1015 family)